jgi:Sec-independent protein translocase protein TatA
MFGVDTSELLVVAVLALLLAAALVSCGPKAMPAARLAPPN